MKVLQPRSKFGRYLLERRLGQVVHRDISPDNLMVDINGRVKLLDFGIARARSTQVTTRVGILKGKLRYMAPELLASEAATPSSDIYALGATLYELVTNHRPYEHVTAPAAILQAIAQRELRPAKQLRPSLPFELVQIIDWAMDPNPKRRPASAKALGKRLLTFIEKFEPPSQAAIGLEVSLWMDRFAESGSGRRKPGSFGQLETTECLPAYRREDELAPLAELSGGNAPTVELAHALDDTQFNLPAARRESPALDLANAKTDPRILPKVILDPELEKDAKRSKTPRRKKKG